MTIQFKIEENDYLIFQLYTASKNKRLQNKRLRNKILVPVLYLGCAAYLFWIGAMLMGFLFVSIAVLWFILYPIFEKSKMMKHYLITIRENHKEVFGRTTTIKFLENEITASDEVSETKIIFSEIKEFV